MPSQTLTNVVAQASPPQVVAMINAISDTGTLRGRIQAFAFAGASTPTSRRTARPKGAFHAASAGVAIGSSAFSAAPLNAHALTVALQVPVAVANGHAISPEAALANELVGGFEGELDALEEALFYGDSGVNPDQYDGLATVLDSLANAQVVNAGGDTADGCTEAYVIALASEAQAMGEANGAEGLLWGIGGNGRIDIRPWSIQQVNEFDGSGVPTNKVIPSHTTEVTGRVGLHIGAPYAICRIANIDSDHPLTDDLIDAALDKVKVRNADIVVVGSRAAITSRRKWLRSLGGATGAMLNRDDVELLTSDFIKVDLDPVT